MPNGEGIIMNFCLERFAVPNYTEHKIGDGGRVEMNTVESQTSLGNMEREHLCAIVLNIDAARRLHRWLGGHIEQIEKRETPNA